MNERLEETGVEALLPEVADEPSVEEATASPAPTATPAPASPSPSWLHLAYSMEFLIALIAIFTVWSQVGGQGHLDLLPWYSKLLLTLALAWCCVRFTAGLVEQPGWTRRTTLWFAGIVIVSIAMAGLTYYYHLHEVPDESDSDDTTATTVSLERWRL